VIDSRHMPGALALVLALAGPVAAHAGIDGDGGQHTIDELVITAQKRPQSLQDTPIVVTSVSAQQLQDAGVRDIKDLTILAPGLTVTTTNSSAVTTARIRGIGTVGDNPGLESSVGVVIDGVYRPRNGVAYNDLGDLERIEVLKGPQGTLFGKNTTAGVINILTKRPEFGLHASSEASVGNRDGFGAALSLTGPLVGDQLAGRLYLAGRAADGYYRAAGAPNNDQDAYIGRLQLLYAPSAAFDANLAVDYAHRRERCCGAVQIRNGPFTPLILSLAPGALLDPPDPAAFRDTSNRSFLKTTVDEGTSLEVNWRTPWLGAAKLTSITAYRQWRQVGGTDADWTGADLIYVPGFEDPNPGSTKFSTFSQELRLAGETDRVHWLVGAFYAHEDLGLHVRTFTYGRQYEPLINAFLGGQLGFFTGALGPGGTFRAGAGQDDLYGQREETVALFTNTSVNLTRALELTVGLRATWEDKDLTSAWSNTDGGVGCATALARAAAIGGPFPASGAFVRAGGLLGPLPYAVLCAVSGNPRFGRVGTSAQHLSEDKLSGTAKLAWRISPQTLAYASYARGYKAGGFNLDRVAGAAQTVAGQAAAPVLDTRFAPEMVDSYELGLKNTLIARTLLANVTGFYQTFHDFQLNSFNGAVFSVNSVPRVISKGIDADLLWFTPVEGLTLSGGVTYAETGYPRDTPPALGAALPGARLSLAPLWSEALSATYERPLTEGLTGRLIVNAKRVSAFNTGSDLDPVKTQPGFTLVNARIGVGSADRRWMLEAWAENLFDKTYEQVAFSALFQPGSYDAFLGAPRTYGLTLRYSY
jgi:outer membrane receptor protein involved in Fe transport